MPDLVADRHQFRVPVDQGRWGVAAEGGGARKATATVIGSDIDDVGVGGEVSSRRSSARICVAGECWVTDRAVDWDGVPAVDVAGQPGLPVRVLQEEVACRAEADAPGAGKRVGLGRAVLKVGEDHGGLLRPENVRQRGRGHCLNAGTATERQHCADLNASDSNSGARQKVRRLTVGEVKRVPAACGVEEVAVSASAWPVLVQDGQNTLKRCLLLEVTLNR